MRITIHAPNGDYRVARTGEVMRIIPRQYGKKSCRRYLRDLRKIVLGHLQVDAKELGRLEQLGRTRGWIA